MIFRSLILNPQHFDIQIFAPGFLTPELFGITLYFKVLDFIWIFDSFQDLVQYLATNSKYLQMFKNEDTSVGTWLGPLKIHRVHDVRFDTEFRSRGCNNRYLVSHKQSVEDFRSKHYSLQAKGLLCENEVKTRMSYQYNWNTVPSKCCVRNDTSLP